MYLNDVTDNAKMTIGLTINQAGNDDEILAFKSSDVTHGFTDVMEADTYGALKKVSANTGGMKLVGANSGDNYGLYLLGVNCDNTPAEPGISIRAEKGDGGTGSENFAKGELAILMSNGSQEFFYMFGGPQVALGSNTAYNTKMSAGLTIDQAGADDEILAFKSSDVAHGITVQAETDTYGFFKKFNATGGGISMWGLTEGSTAIAFYPVFTSADTTKSSAGVGSIYIDAYLKDGTSVQAPAANTNLITLRSGGSTVWIADSDGDTWQSGGAEFGGIVTKPAQPAFCIFLDGNFTITPDDVNDVVEFDDEHFDQGSNFNVGTYTFTAPVTGKYQFNVTLTLGTVDLDADYMYLKLVTDNREYRGGYLFPAAYDTDLDDLSISMSVLADMTAGHTAFVEVYQTGGNASTVKSAAGLSHFSGFLAC
jgi:hypothetical protein